MKLLVALGACFLVAFSQANALLVNKTSPESFVKIAANHTEFLLSQEENPTNLATCFYKLLGMDEAAERFRIELPGRRILNELGFQARSILTPARALASIQETQNYFIKSINRLNVEREPVSSESEINRIIDEFSDEIAERAPEVFDGMYTMAVNAEQETEEISAKFPELLDELAEKLDECLRLPANAFREIFQCHAESRLVVQRMTLDITTLGKIAEQLRSDFFEQAITLDSEFSDKLRELVDRIAELKQGTF